MTTEEAIDNYTYLSQENFAKKPRRLSSILTLGMLRTGDRTAHIEEALKKMIGNDWETELL